MRKKKLLRKMRLSRPSDAFLPLALLAACLLGESTAIWNLFLAYFAVKICSLCTADGARIAFSTQPSLRDVRGSVLLALCMQLVGGGIAIGIPYKFFELSMQMLLLFGAGLALHIEQVFYEYLFATGDSHSASLCRLLTSILIWAGLMLSSGTSAFNILPIAEMWVLGAALLGMLISIIIGIAFGGFPKGRLNVQIMRSIPRAMLQTLFFPMLALAIFFLRRPAIKLDFIYELGLLPTTELSFGFCIGLMLFNLYRTPFRRSSMESRTMNRTLLLIIAASAFIWGAWLIPAVSKVIRSFTLLSFNFAYIPGTCLMIILSACCTLLLFAHMPWQKEL